MPVFASESSKNKNKTTEISMEELVGNTDGFAESGYGHFHFNLWRQFLIPH